MSNDMHAPKAHRQRRPSMDYRLLPSGQTLVYLRDAALADSVVDQYRECLQGPLGIDIEYKPNFSKGRPPNKTALLQLASIEVVLLVQLSAMSEFPRTVRDIIQDHAIIKAGVGIQGDAAKLWRDFGISPAGCLELSYLARAVDTQWASSKGLIGLARLVKAYEVRSMKKPKRIQMSNWELLLSQEQQDYAADDANAGLAILRKLNTILPSITPPPDEAFYLFRLLHGRPKTTTGAPWPRPLPVAKVPQTTPSATEASVGDLIVSSAR